MFTLAGAALLGQKVLRTATVASGSPLLLGRMKWLNDPASATVSGGNLVVQALPKTEFWRKTFYGYITDNGHFFHLPVGGDLFSKPRSMASTRRSTTRLG